jgi:cell division protein FtsW
MVLFFASWLSNHQRWLPFLFWTGLPVGLLMLQPDLGSTLIVISIAVGMYFVAGGSIKKLAVLGLVGLIGTSMLVASSPYRMERVKTFVNSDYDPLGAGFHVRQITIALGNGGAIGQGIGKSKQKFSYIPEVSNDSIFAIVAEELGFLGSSLIVALFGLYFATSASILKQTKPGSYEYLVTSGVLIWLGSQTILNLSAVVVLVPLTGLPLPFFSYGGSSLIMILLASGIISSTGRKS